VLFCLKAKYRTSNFINERILIMNGRNDNDLNIIKQIDIDGEECVRGSYEPTTNELDDNNPPSEDSGSSDSDSD